MGLALLLAGPAGAQPAKFGQADERTAPGQADQAEGARILREFQAAGIAGDYWLAFELRVMPRRGEERVVAGTMIGTRGPTGPRSRITLGAERWLIASGPQPAAWILQDGRAVAADPGQALGDTGITLFDLQMPYLYWQDFTYEGEARVRGRPTDSFILRPPAGAAADGAVRVLIDSQFQALVRAELLDDKGAAEKTISLLALKKVGEQSLVKTIDVRDERARDKTRFSVRAAALGLVWPAGLFEPAGLAAEPPPVPAARIEQL